MQQLPNIINYTHSMRYLIRLSGALLLILVLIFSYLHVSSVHADVTNGLVAEWTFNEGAGSTVADGIGSHTGTISGATWVAGKNGSALQFASGQQVSVPDS